MAQVTDPVIGQCRKCKSDIYESHEYVWCVVCNAPISDDVNARRKPNKNSAGNNASVNVNVTNETAQQPAPKNSSRTSALLYRYNDAFLVAKATTGIGTTIKVVGFVLAALIVLGSFIFAGTVSSTSSNIGKNDTSGISFFIIVIGIYNAVLVGFIFYVIGVIVSAQGQILKASLDNTVGNSPFLTNDLKAKIMSLPEA